MERIGFAFNPTKPRAIGLRDRALAWCREHEVAAWSLESQATDELVKGLADVECLIVLGGDGTFLRATRALAQVDVPVLGINSGRIGFLSKVEPEAMETTLANLAADRFEIEPRMMLEATLIRGAHPDGPVPAATSLR